MCTALINHSVKIWWSSEDLISQYNFVSSAYMYIVDVILSGRSLIYIRNNKGPNTLP